LNPDEYLNRDLKYNLNNKPLVRAKGKLEEHAKEHIGNDSSAIMEKIKELFAARTMKYAS